MRDVRGDRGIGHALRSFPRAAPGRDGDPGLFGPGTAAWRINGESALLLGGGRALLMQIAHPDVAAGVADHSDFTREPFERLWRTVDTALTVVFGDATQWGAAVDRVNGIHARVRGERDGRPYSATDPELLLWVHATLVDSSLVAYETFVRPLPPTARERYYQEMKRMGSAFGIPDDLHPADHDAFRSYVANTVDALEIGAESRAVARHVLTPDAPLALAPALLLGGLASVGLLPPRIRAGLGLRWNRGTQAAFSAFAAAVRATRPLLPDRVRRWSHAREAERRVVELGRGAGHRPRPLQEGASSDTQRDRERLYDRMAWERSPTDPT